KTMNSPFGTSRLIPLTAGTTPNCLTIFLAETADMNPPRIQRSLVSRRLFPRAARDEPDLNFVVVIGPGPRSRAVRIFRSGLFEPLLVDDLALLRGPLDRILG